MTRADDDQIKFRLKKDVAHKLRVKCAQLDTSIQDVMERATAEFLKGEGKDGRE